MRGRNMANNSSSRGRTGNGEDIIIFIKAQRLRRFRYVERMEDNAMPKRMIKGKLYSKRRKENPSMRW
jgi:hypothetical protein